MAKSRLVARKNRAKRVRYKLRQVAAGVPRLSVHRTSRHIYAQIIDDQAGKTLASASTLEKSFVDSKVYGGNRKAAETIGRTIAERAVAVEIKSVVFDRGGYLYHGRMRALAEAAREAGLKF